MSLEGYTKSIDPRPPIAIFRMCSSRCTDSEDLCKERIAFKACQECKTKEYPELFTRRDLHTVLLNLKDKGVSLKDAASISGIPRNAFEKMAKWDRSWPDWPHYFINDPKTMEFAGSKGPGEIIEGLTADAMNRLLQACK
jgi:hypothetical protein